ncbi:Oidioi.mRNA.OKI2018_I69.chr1.g1911.t1.cds [Oikopleura dioica]|uniref:Oidioi.mRNA.OKI2018_I69.chr1.g1911.t1.cds n=1 Tax=Oikopleura dioica TaxID=34765 RepID=A0ABN7SWC6_OIKDI|nr:Oidioi.mRNA.OKI2018_I69.chr1.g1911.t1.cds [Oikopleura dioica]
MLIKNMIGEPAAANMEAVSEPISPSASKFTTKVPLSDPSFPLRLKYRTHSGGVRIGRVLEDLDTLAGIASYKHNLSLAR